MNRLVLSISFLLILFLNIVAQNTTTSGEYLPRQYPHGDIVLNYRIMYPDDFDEGKKYPLVLFLHGAGDRGNDNKSQLIYGSKLFKDSLNKYPAIVLYPQCPEGESWSNYRNINADNLSITDITSSKPSPSLSGVISLCDKLLQESYIDADRFYVSGLSMGGFGTWEMLWRIPEKIAAAAPICGGGLTEMTGRMTDVPIWAFHGVKDDVVSYQSTLKMIREVQRRDGIAKISLYPNASHNSWDTAFAEPRFLSWMFSKRKSGSTTPRVDSLLNLMTIEEKIGQFNLVTQGGAVTGTVISKDVEDKIRAGNVGAIFGTRGAGKMRKIQEIAVNESRLGIPLITGLDVIHGHQTVLPIPLGLSCSWDMELIEQGARMAAREATANGVMWNFSPMVDIARDPRWGRIAESAGEDPFLGSKMAEAFVRGYQQNDLSHPTSMMACVKHFAAYGAPEGGRDYATVDMSKVKLYNEYLPPYKAAIDAGEWGLS